MAAVQPACLADLNDDLLRKIASRLAESELVSAVALKRCSSRFKDLATPLVANAVSVTNEKWRDAASKIGGRVGAKSNLLALLERNEALTKLSLYGNGIGDEGAKALASALRVDAVLITFNLRSNDIGCEGAVAIGKALEANAVLTDLNLFNNNIRDEGAAAIAEALRGNEVLTTLDLSGSPFSPGGIGPEGASAIAEALKVNEVLKELYLTSNSIGAEGAKAIGKALAVNEVLAELVLMGNNIGDEGAAALASALRVNGVLKSIDLRHNNLGDASSETRETTKITHFLLKPPINSARVCTLSARPFPSRFLSAHTRVYLKTSGKGSLKCYREICYCRGCCWWPSRLRSVGVTNQPTNCSLEQYSHPPSRPRYWARPHRA